MPPLTPPPRTIPALLRWQMMLGGAGAQVGWLLMGFGSLFFWSFGMNADLSGWRFRPDTMATAVGRTLGCSPTGFSVGDEERQSSRVYRNPYYFEVEGRGYTASSFATGQCLPNGPVQVEYLVDHPEVSRIAGMYRRPLGPWAIVVALVPGVGLVLALAGLFKGRRYVGLLREGLPAPGRLIEKKALASRTMGRQDYRMTYEFTPFGAPPQQRKLRTHRPEMLESDEGLTVLYDAAKPSNAMPVAALPGRVSVDPSGQPTGSRTRAFFFLPAVTLLGNAWYVWQHW